MSQFQSEHPTPPQTDEYGNPVHHGGTQGGQHQEKGMMDKVKDKLPCGANKDDQCGTTHTTTATKPGHGTAPGEHQEKGMVDKVKDKLPGGANKDDQCGTTHTATATKPGHGTAPGEHQEKGMMDKIKEKLPGGRGTTR